MQFFQIDCCYCFFCAYSYDILACNGYNSEVLSARDNVMVGTEGIFEPMVFENYHIAPTMFKENHNDAYDLHPWIKRRGKFSTHILKFLTMSLSAKIKLLIFNKAVMSLRCTPITINLC